MSIFAAKFCPGCDRNLNILDFASDVAHSDGLNSYCRTCDSERNRRYRQRIAAQRRRPDPERTYQECRSCGGIKPLSAYHRDSMRPLGRMLVCRDCRNIAPPSAEVVDLTGRPSRF